MANVDRTCETCGIEFQGRIHTKFCSPSCHYRSRTNLRRAEPLTAERLRELLHYEPETGIFTWLVSFRGGSMQMVAAGSEAGSYITGHLYRKISVDGKRHYAHRLAFLWMTGEWPKNNVDHRNGIGDDNRWRNLRDVTTQTNAQNAQRIKSDNRLGVRGVRMRDLKYVAKVTVGRHATHLGTFDTPEQAHAAYMEAKARLHEGYIPGLRDI